MRLLGVFPASFEEAGALPPHDVPAGPRFFSFADEEVFANLLVDSGLSDVRIITVSFDHQIQSAEDLWQGMLGGTVRTSAFYLGQPEQTRHNIRAAFDRLILDYRRGDWFELPISVKLASGIKFPNNEPRWRTGCTRSSARSAARCAGVPRRSRCSRFRRRPRKHRFSS
jgi:hypothetical protein